MVVLTRQYVGNRSQPTLLRKENENIICFGLKQGTASCAEEGEGVGEHIPQPYQNYRQVVPWFTFQHLGVIDSQIVSTFVTFPPEF